jgi:hypothetical protein
MRKLTITYLEKMISKVLKENLGDKAETLVSKIKSSIKENSEVCEQCGGNMNEGECMECGYNMMEEGIHDVEDINNKDEFDYVQEEEIETETNMENEESCKYHMDKFGPDDDRTKQFCGDSMNESLKGRQRRLDKNKNNKIDAEDFEMLRNGSKSDKTIKKVNKISKRHGMEEAETEEGNAFSGALSNAKKSGKDSFEVDGKEYQVKESKGSLKLTEDELIDMIEKIVMEQKVKDTAEKNNITIKTAQGLKDTDKVLGQNKKVNDDHTKEVVKKMKEYMKDMFMGGNGYEDQPDDFPQSNYDMEKDHKEKKYNPSDAVEEYIENFAYPGMTNLVYDEIKPDDEMIGNQIKGDSKNGNAVTSKDGKALGNVSKRSLKTGERFKKNFDENLYGAEQMNGSYKRVPQPVDVAGDKKQSGSLGKAEKILNKLESTENKKEKIVSEEMNKMKTLIGYNRKTQ